MKPKNRGWAALAYFIALLHVLPFYILVTTSFKALRDDSSKWVMPGYLYLNNFLNAWREAKLGTAFTNNLLITVLSVALVLIIGAAPPTHWPGTPAVSIKRCTASLFPR
ncbi:hypothetical protein LJK87_31535 [Paenibacillus sp. P25]|nr:hypothetical protein LJK87_31535 [Paenibacillus sp. P25]